MAAATNGAEENNVPFKDPGGVGGVLAGLRWASALLSGTARTPAARLVLGA